MCQRTGSWAFTRRFDGLRRKGLLRYRAWYWIGALATHWYRLSIRPFSFFIISLPAFSTRHLAYCPGQMDEWLFILYRSEKGKGSCVLFSMCISPELIDDLAGVAWHDIPHFSLSLTTISSISSWKLLCTLTEAKKPVFESKENGYNYLGI